MNFLSNSHHLSLITILSLLLILTTTDARPTNLLPSDHKAFLTIQNNLNINQTHLTNTPCNNPGVFCEKRINENNTYVLRITRLIFKSRRLVGVLSPAIGRLTELKELSLPSNQIVGHVPYQVINCKKLEILDLSYNNLSGVVPLELSKLTRLRILDLSFNEFTGNLSFLKGFMNLERLSLAGNLFTGKVPETIRSFRNLHFFDFSKNSLLKGPVPVMTTNVDEFAQYPRRSVLAKSPASLSMGSSAPEGQAKAPGSGDSPPPTEAPDASVAKEDKKKKAMRKLAGWVIGFLVGSIAGLSTGIVFSVVFLLMLATIRGAGRGDGPAIFASGIKKADVEFLEKDDGLASLEIIGHGGCGEVYKAVLPENGKTIAIKKIVQPPKDAAELAEEDSKVLHRKMRQIRSEINTVGKIRHRNLLPLLAHVSRPNCHYLVYEFMKNGSLHDMLCQVAQGERELDWLARHKIALGVAAGLEYLHLNHSPRIIHRDLKPGNILLDDDMEAKIADFGLAKAMPDANTHMSASNVAGTVGYIAPEYHQTLKLSDKCDIYSFGVILAVLVTGKLPSDEFFQSTREIGLVKWLRNVVPSENPSQAIDPKLMGNGFEGQMLLVLKIAYFCTLEDPKQRPNSKEVITMLHQIKHD